MIPHFQNEKTARFIKTIVNLILENPEIKIDVSEDKIIELVNEFLSNYTTEMDFEESWKSFFNKKSEEFFISEKSNKHFSEFQNELENIKSNKVIFDMLYLRKNFDDSATLLGNLLEVGNFSDFQHILMTTYYELAYETNIMKEIVENENKDIFYSYYSDKKEIEKMFLEQKCVPSLDMKVTDLVQIYNEYKTLKEPYREDFIQQRMLTIFDNEKIISLGKKWTNCTLLKKDIELINKSLSEYLEGDYISSIHILIPKIESLLVALSGKSGSVDHKDLRNEIKTKKRWVVSKSKLFMLEMAYKYLNKNFLTPFEHGKENPLTRNSVLHGAFYGKFKKYDSLKLILFYDLLFEILKPTDSYWITKGN